MPVNEGPDHWHPSAWFRPAAAAWNRVRRWRHLRIAIRLTAIAVAVACVLAARFGGTSLVAEEPITDPDAIVMLASHEWERLPATVEMARRFPHAVVLLTLPRELNRWNCFRCYERPDQLVALGVTRDRIRELPQRVFRTYDEATATRAYALEQGFSRMLVVTSPYHTRRAYDTFRHVFAGTSVRVGIHAASRQSRSTPSWWWLRRTDRNYVVYEWSARLFYLVRFGVT